MLWNKYPLSSVSDRETVVLARRLPEESYNPTCSDEVREAWLEIPRAYTEKVELAVNTMPRFTGLPGLTFVVMPPGEVNARESALASTPSMGKMKAAKL